MSFIKNLGSELQLSVTKYRTACMGVAMIWVFLFHSPSKILNYLPDGLYGTFISYGYLGVDLFLFISAFGLCYSLDKNSLGKYFKNRIFRILPTFLLVLFAVHALGLIVEFYIPILKIDYPHDLIDSIFWYTGLGYFFEQCHYEWYIPSLLLLYTIAPVLYKMEYKKLLIAFVSSLVVSYVLSYNEIFPYLERLYGRIPIFVLGFCFYKGLCYNLLTGGVTVASIVLVPLYFYDKCPDTIPFCFSVPLVLVLISKLMRVRILYVIFSFVGSISLEFYLIHCYRRPQALISLFTQSHFLQVTLAIVLCCFLGWIMQKCIKNMMTFLTK